jgi:predicted ATPase
MAKPTQDEVTKEVKTLREQLKTVRYYSGFGDDNRSQIKAQIRVAEEDMDSDDINDTFDGEDQSAAFQMRDWMDYGSDGDDGSPSEGWAPLCK